MLKSLSDLGETAIIQQKDLSPIVVRPQLQVAVGYLRAILFIEHFILV